MEGALSSNSTVSHVRNTYTLEVFKSFNLKDNVL